VCFATTPPRPLHWDVVALHMPKSSSPAVPPTPPYLVERPPLKSHLPPPRAILLPFSLLFGTHPHVIAHLPPRSSLPHGHFPSLASPFFPPTLIDSRLEVFGQSLLFYPRSALFYFYLYSSSPPTVTRIESPLFLCPLSHPLNMCVSSPFLFSLQCSTKAL